MADREFCIDESHWPIVRITAPAENPDADGFERHLAGVDALLARRHPFVIVFDARAGRGMSAWERDRLRKHRRAVFFETQRYQRGIAFVIASSFQRAILWLAPEPCPSRLFATIDEAEEWAMSCLSRVLAA